MSRIAPVLAAVWLASRLAGAVEFSASEILALSEKSRSPEESYAVDFTITVRDDRQEAPVRSTAYAMLVQGRDRSMVLTLSPPQHYGGSLLIASGEYWLLLPNAERPLQLARDQIVRGDVGNGDLARSNLAAEYSPRLDRIEPIDGERCYRLELTASRSSTRYPRVVSWVSARTLRTRRLDFYDRAGRLEQSARYVSYRKTPVGNLPERIDVRSGIDPHQTTAIAFTNARPVDLAAVRFTPDGLAAFKTAAVRLSDAQHAQPRLEAIVTDMRGVP
jgi:hypothetical protein